MHPTSKEKVKVRVKVLAPNSQYLNSLQSYVKLNYMFRLFNKKSSADRMLGKEDILDTYLLLSNQP